MLNLAEYRLILADEAVGIRRYSARLRRIIVKCQRKHQNINRLENKKKKEKKRITETLCHTTG